MGIVPMDGYGGWRKLAAMQTQVMITNNQMVFFVPLRAPLKGV
jgi:hypothetical protein